VEARIRLVFSQEANKPRILAGSTLCPRINAGALTYFNLSCIAVGSSHRISLTIREYLLVFQFCLRHRKRVLSFKRLNQKRVSVLLAEHSRENHIELSFSRRIANIRREYDQWNIQPGCCLKRWIVADVDWGSNSTFKQMVRRREIRESCIFAS
jgi:hypothetical protein